jgi:hypothetical protein
MCHLPIRLGALANTGYSQKECASADEEDSRIFAQRLGRVLLRDDPKFTKLRELPSETLMRVDTICESGLADLDCA